MSIIIHLTPEEEERALAAGKERNNKALARGNRNRHGAKANRTEAQDLALHVAGARGELAAAKAYEVEAPLLEGVYHRLADIGLGGEVRTRSRASYDLIVRNDDSDDRYFILVIGTDQAESLLEVVGGIYGDQAKKDQFRKNYGGKGYAWFVPRESLEPAEDAPKGML